MGLSNLQLQFKYRSDYDSIHRDFYEPCLNESIRYDRAAGYFSSESLKIIAKGLEVFLYNGGHIRLVANPYLLEKDIHAIKRGYKAKVDVIESALLRELEVTANSIEKETLNILAWLIYKNQLEIKIAFTNNNSLYHEKFGFFEDISGYNIAFSGSSNETVGGVKNNFEKIDVFSPEKDLHRIEDMKQDFKRLWYNETPGLTIIDIPRIVHEKLLENKGNMPKKQSKRKELTPRNYQVEAIQALQRNNWQGILEMATGTGKTITSLLAMMQYKKENNRAFVVIFAPFKHLVDQWKKECTQFGVKFPTMCYESKAKWLPELEQEVRNFNIGISDFHVVITTYDAAANDSFVELISKIQQHAFLIADECHYLGSPQFRQVSLANIKARIGLSATPDRWWDEKGTMFLKDFFKDVVYTYSLDEAIAANKLTQYTYEPHIVSLTETELDSYNKLTRKIINHLNKKDTDDEKLSHLNRKRALILAKASQKIPRLVALLREKRKENIFHTIVYCAENQVNELTVVLSQIGLRVHKFDSTVPTKERQRILDAFAMEKIQVLVAIKCLDEGVDVPSTRCAYFLASTSNPREFVQRRGRILRTAPGKHLAEIHDFIVLPEDVDEKTFTMIAKKELPRFAEFSNSAINRSSSKNKILPYISPYNLNHLMDMKPWDVYKEMKEENDSEYFK
ncbi:DEAD/DEAH box helicase family protein [Priestia megaterium]|uniref:DEAD/DEAH box helicase family protein n=1 Tax=Priestia megaterium TaxID=1404 RepID=UPI002FFDEF52